MSERTEKIAWGVVLLSIIGAGIFGWWRQKKASIGGYDDVKDIKPMTLHGSTRTATPSAEEKPKAQKCAVKRACDPVEIAQESKSNTQILACHGEPLGKGLSFGKVRSAQDAYDLLQGQSQLLQEELIVLAMDSQNNVKATAMVHRGFGNGVHVNPADVFRVPIVHGATRMIIAHNHPTGSVEPSPSDVALTKKMKGLGDEMGIVLTDHIIVGKKGFLSFRDMGILQ